ncbi:hypothetical protein MKEN_01363200 [Mycena kentingensis (nom. inval.)]|nr:hypothetical protein MKEN_01363200 [Mycena kentingensis (nom. inval.)]
MTIQQRTLLTIAGSDSGGGAGIQADLRTFAAFGHFGTSAITALTAQNTTGVQGVRGVPPAFLQQQIASVLDDIEVHALKTGMLFDAANTLATVNSLKSHYPNGEMPPLVCDPVCVSTSGHSLLAPDALDILKTRLLPLATVVTPNKSEAELLLSRSIDSLEDMLDGGRELLQLGCRSVLLKGGHLTTTSSDVQRIAATGIRVAGSDENVRILTANTTAPTELVVDVLCEADGPATLFTRPRIDSFSTHGTGCTLSAALACALAEGASTYTHLGIVTATPIGHGHGPLNHLHSLVRRQIPLPTPANPHPADALPHRASPDTLERLCRARVRPAARARDASPRLLRALYRARLPLPAILRARARLLAAKAASYPLIAAATQTINNILTELDTHRALCAQFGLTAEDLDGAEESAETMAYGSYLLDVGLQGDTTKLLIVVLACLLGYGEVGLWLTNGAGSLEGNPYRQWIEDYAGPGYQGAVTAGLELIEKVAAADPPSPARLEDWCAVWDRCTKLEKAFWDMGLRAGNNE